MDQQGSRNTLTGIGSVLQEINVKHETSSVLGHLVEVTGQYFVAELHSDLEGISSDKMIGMDKVRIGQVGSYLMVRQSGTKVLCMVESMWTETAERGEDIYKVRLSPIGEFNSNGDFDRGINHFPTAGAELHAVSNWNLERIFSDFSEVYYKVGKLSSFESIDVYLDASNFFGRQAASLGRTGSGKCWTVTSLIQ